MVLLEVEIVEEIVEWALVRHCEINDDDGGGTRSNEMGIPCVTSYFCVSKRWKDIGMYKFRNITGTCIVYGIFKLLNTIGPFTLAKPEKPITFGVFGTKSACAKKPESHTCVLVSGAHARLLSTFDRTRVVRITSRAAVGWFRWRSRTTWPKTRIIPARLERAFTLAKNQWNFGGVSKNQAAEVDFWFGFFGVFRGSCLATFNENPNARKILVFLCQCKRH